MIIAIQLLIILLACLNAVILLITGFYAFARWICSVPPIDVDYFSFDEIPSFVDEQVLKTSLGKKGPEQVPPKIPEKPPEKK